MSHWRARALLLRPTVVLAAVVLAACGGSNPKLVDVDVGAGLQGLEGLEASVYASGLEHAAAMAFDEAGRLWVATAAYDDNGTDAVSVVEGPGDEPSAVVTGVHTPLGLLWVGDTLYVAAQGGVEAYTGFDGASFGEHHTIVTLDDGEGEVNGLAMGSDGRISLGVSAPCDSCTPTSEHAAAVLSFLPDGSDLRVDASGIRAPVGLAYFPGTDTLYVTMNQRDDLGEATPGDWLSIVEPGQDWGFPDCYGQGGDVCDGAPHPVAELDQHAAVGGVAIITGELGDDVGTAAVVAEWSTGLVLMVPLADDGAKATGPAEVLLTGVVNPVAVATDPDGALLVADWSTGTIYQVSPSSQTALTAS